MSRLSLDDARTLFERRRAAYLACDVEAYLALWSDDMVIELPGRSPIVGKADYRKLVDQSFSYLRPCSFEFHRLAVIADHVLAEWTIRAERRADGHPVRWDGMSSARIEGSRIRHWREYWDPADLQR